VAGIALGYLINSLADVLPHSPSTTKPLCTNKECRQPQAWKDYLLFKRCSNCNKGHNVRSFLTPMLMLAASLYLWLKPTSHLGYVLGVLALAYFLLVAVIDLEHRLILRPLSIGGFVLAGTMGWLMHGWKSTLIGSLFGFGVMFLFYLIGRLVTKNLARKQNLNPAEAEEAFGSGDVTLATILGLFLGWPLIWFGLLLGVLLLGIGVIPLTIYLAVRRRLRKEALQMYIPIGPPFILSTILLVFLPNWITTVIPR
jgi:leader peptidase (prepilin peptidase) / N-methyltransferase